MRATALTLIVLGSGFLGGPVAAQEGHPLKGSWIGVWESNQTHGDFVLLILNWDGREITGTINPGTDDIVITNATLDPDGWEVHLEADGEDSSGRSVDYVIDGVIGELELPSRSITGTWRNGRESGRFEIRRQ